MKIPKEAIDITLSVLNTTQELHYRSCFGDIIGEPEFDCNCPIKDIVDKLLKIKYSQK